MSLTDQLFTIHNQYYIFIKKRIPMQDSLIGSKIGDCRIEEKIGQGSMGCVYKGYHLELDIPVAVKILQAVTYIPDARERFLREARISTRIHHPNIVDVIDIGSQRGIHFIIMEYVQGDNLLTVIKKKGRISRESAISIALDILKALELALEHKIVHRDIKPENILVTKTGKAKLADLGLARMGGEVNLTKPNTTLGSPHYISPEQIEKSSEADHRSDIYSLGCTLYHAITGTVPFPGNSLIQIMLAHQKKPVPLISKTVKSADPNLCRIVARMMQKKQSARFQTPTEVICALNKIYHKTKPKNCLILNNKTSTALYIILSSALLIFAALLAILLT